MPLTVTTTLKRTPPAYKRGASLYAKAKRYILGDVYTLSLTFIGETLSKRLNTTYRGKQKPTNVLAFPLSRHEGEICITLPYALREAHQFGLAQHEHLLYLFVHGCIHLKGYDHGERMEAQEKKILKKLSSPHPNNFA